MMRLTKRRTFDKRSGIAYKVHSWGWEWKHYRAAIVWGIIVGLLVGIILCNPFDISLEPLGQKIEKVEAKETPCDFNALHYIRCRGQQLGYDDYTISKFIRIARAESGFNLDQYAKNKNSTAKGIFQFIDSTWRRYCLTMGNIYDFKANIDCFYHVLKVDGYYRGLNHWNASKSKWL